MRKYLLAFTVLGASFTLPTPAQADSKAGVVAQYADIVYANYKDAYEDGLALQKSVQALLDDPTEETLEAAKQAWTKSRKSYGATEAFRFYEGPIDAEDGPEGRLNSWPVNEAYIDYVQGAEKSGIVQDPNVEITKAVIVGKNQERDEADVATGYHAIEFLLWGQDLSLDSAGARPVSDYKDTEDNARRRAYLKIVTEILVEDLKYLADQWKPGADNYAKTFLQQDVDATLGNVLTALATLSGFELASERIATALDSGDQEDEHSCFSDTTHNDFIANVKGLRNVYFGKYNDVKGDSLYELLEDKDEELAEKIEKQIFTAMELAENLPQPIDREVLAAPATSEGRKRAEELVKTLQELAESFKLAGSALGVDVHIASE